MAQQERSMSYVFVRMHFPEIFGQNAKTSLFDYLLKMQDRKEEIKEYYWAFGDVGKIDIDGKILIFGRLGKTAKSRFEVVYDEEHHSYKKELLNIQKTNYSNFFVSADSNVIAYEENPNISKLQFQKHFANIWLTTSGTKIEFEFLLQEVEIFNVIRTWDRLVRAKFKLVPTNPSSREDYEPLDEFIKRARAEKAKLEFENEATGLSIEGNTPVHQGLSMASAGYGEFDVRGVKGRVGQRASSKGMEIKRDFVRIDDLEALSPDMMKEIRKIVEAMNRPDE